MVRVFKVSPNVAKMMEEYYEDFRREKTPPYAKFQADSADVVVTLYESGKAMFQGVSADIEAQLWIDQEKHLNGITIENKGKEDKKDKKDTKEKNTVLFWKTGVCGGFTTFSTFSLEAFNLIEKKAYLAGGSYMLLSVVFCFMGVICGRKLSMLTH